MTNEKFDVVILGGGNAGIGVTGPVRRAGMCNDRTPGSRRHLPEPGLHAEEDPGCGRTCLARDRARRRPSHFGRQARLDWAGLIDREKAMVKDIPSNLAQAMATREVVVIEGQATLAGLDTIRVGNRILEPKHIVIATGSKPRPLPILGAEHMITSDEILSDRALPGAAIFIGVVVISFELGHVYARAGVGVMILEALAARILGAHVVGHEGQE